MTLSDAPLRVGIVRPARPESLVADIEARVIGAELTRRLDSVSVDLRVEGDAIGPWASRSTASWPIDIDVEVDAALLWGDGVPSLCAIFGRTVDDDAAEVRRRMLAHLDIGGRPLDNKVFESAVPWRPTDAWLLAERDGVAPGASPDLIALADRSPATAAALDSAFDSVVDQVIAVVGELRRNAVVARLRARVAELEQLVATITDDACRERAETNARLDQLASTEVVVEERRARDELDRS